MRLEYTAAHPAPQKSFVSVCRLKVVSEMQNIERRSFLGAAIAALPLALVGQSIKTPTASKAALVSRGEDRLGERHVLGVSTTAFKVLTQDTGGGLFIIEHASPRQVPHAWAFVGDTPGKLLIAFAPANKMEQFFRDNAKRRKDGEYLNDAALYHAYGLELLGPPLSLGGSPPEVAK
jgi:hypothetical protein